MLSTLHMTRVHCSHPSLTDAGSQGAASYHRWHWATCRVHPRHTVTPCSVTTSRHFYTSYRPKVQLKPLDSVQLSNRFIRELAQSCYKVSEKDQREGSLHLNAKPALTTGRGLVCLARVKGINRQSSILKPQWWLRWHPPPSICIVIASGSHFFYQGRSPCLILNHEQRRKVITQPNYLFSIWSFIFPHLFSSFALWQKAIGNLKSPSHPQVCPSKSCNHFYLKSVSQ